ncbi:Uncharacterized protein OBRU01_08887 [Operophtera brumata]|uniref:Cytochrome P450 n=1 Tax=Operophtera brumata TaxID=104452 RepID=A0A0L7LGZ5_OPEBR|nr:Uncharacterized protein OBRU01_08887 [Operophtera brumata]
MPNYGKRAIESYNDVVNEEIDLLLETLRGDEAGLNCNIYTPIVKATSYMVCQALMGLSREQTMELPYLQELIDITPKLICVPNSEAKMAPRHPRHL